MFLIIPHMSYSSASGNPLFEVPVPNPLPSDDAIFKMSNILYSCSFRGLIIMYPFFSGGR